MPLNASDFGYVSSGACSMLCAACGKPGLYCCDGTGKRLSFNDWIKAVDKEICRVLETDRNEVTFPYAESYQAGMGVMATVDAATR